MKRKTRWMESQAANERSIKVGKAAMVADGLRTMIEYAMIGGLGMQNDIGH